jgi:LemA protein
MTIFIILVLLIWIAILYNIAVGMYEECGHLKANVGTQEKRKRDTFDKYLSMVESGAGFEKTLVIEAAKIRTSKITDIDDQISGFSRVFSGAESNPNAIAVNLFQNFQIEIADTETKIQASKQKYNIAANNLNASIKKFPNNIIYSFILRRKPVSYMSEY